MYNIVQLFQIEVGETWVRRAHQVTDYQCQRSLLHLSAISTTKFRTSSDFLRDEEVFER